MVINVLVFKKSTGNKSILRRILQQCANLLREEKNVVRIIVWLV